MCRARGMRNVNRCAMPTSQRNRAQHHNSSVCACVREFVVRVYTCIHTHTHTYIYIPHRKPKMPIRLIASPPNDVASTHAGSLITGGWCILLTPSQNNRKPTCTSLPYRSCQHSCQHVDAVALACYQHLRHTHTHTYTDGRGTAPAVAGGTAELLHHTRSSRSRVYNEILVG